MRNKLIGIFLIMLVITAAFSVSGKFDKHRNAIATSYQGNTLYVGGWGPNNYTKIQDAINDASDGDTVFVFDDNSPYIENLIIEKSIELIGESRDTTIIDANEQENADVILIKADDVTVKGFTLRNTASGGYPDYDDGIEVWSNNNTITDNIIKDTHVGIQLSEEVKYEGHENNLSNFNHIEGNIITENDFAGIYLIVSNNNIIKRNIISANGFYGIFLYSDNCLNQIGKNTITDNRVGIFIYGGSNNTILQNHIVGNNKYGVYVSYSSYNFINYNNLYDNRINAFVDIDLLNLVIGTFLHHERYISHSWDKNYWGRQYIGPKPIICALLLLLPTLLIGGIINLFTGYLLPIFLPIPQFDWQPAKQPYVI